MANTKLTKRKEDGSMWQVKSDTDSEPELPQNQGNGDLVVDDLSHVHNKCDDLMAKLKALNQAAVDMPTASVVSTLHFVTPVITPVQVENTEVVDKDLSKVVAMADALSENLISYLTGGQIVANLVTVETNTSSEVELDDGIQSLNKENQYELVQPVDVTVIINEAGIHQPLKPTGEMLNELNSGKNKSRKRNEHIKESNIVVSTPVCD